MTYNSPWAGLYLHTDGISTSGNNSLVFSIAGAGASGQNIQVYAYDGNGQAQSAKNLSVYIPGGITSNTWKQVSIPLSDLQASNKTISGVVFQDASGGSGASINLDAIGLQ